MRLHLLAVDCCEHILEKLANVQSSHLTAVASTNLTDLKKLENDVDVIVIGVSSHPVRRLFISQLQQLYPGVPMLMLRRGGSDRELDEGIRGEFVLSEQSGHKSDLEIVHALRSVLPIPPCGHVRKPRNYDTVSHVVRVIYENYSNPELDLTEVARRLPMSPARLSRILNREAGISFRQLLKNARIEEAKPLLASRKYSIKEIAARVGFSDSHYFSRSFKQVTGLSASEYQSTVPIESKPTVRTTLNSSKR